MVGKFKRYHIETKDTPPKVMLPPKYLVKRYNNCTDVQECVQVCIYGVHTVDENGKIAEPKHHLCRGCHLCVLACPKNAIVVSLNPEYMRLGDKYFTPERIETIYFEAETGRVPVSGTGYGGPFAGEGFDGIWFDFSEIVRPTRDGIHGREYISTTVDLGRKLPYLQFDEMGQLKSKVPKNIEIPIPIIFDAPLQCKTLKNLQKAVVRAASKLKTLAIVRAENYDEELMQYKSSIIPRIEWNEIMKFKNLIEISEVVEINCGCETSKIDEQIKVIKKINPEVLISFRNPYDENSDRLAEKLVRAGADIIHFYLEDGQVAINPNSIRDAIQRVHLHLVNSGIREEITFISSGGIAEAAHVPKSIILGADAVALGLAYQIALGCNVCYNGSHSENCPIEVRDNEVDWAIQRIINLMGSWRDQLLEVLGGMGLREARRLRGEMGRAMLYETLEEKVFGDHE